MSHARLPRFKRAAEVARFQLTRRDRQIVQLVHHHRFLRSSQIISLIGDSPQRILRRLQLLYHHGYLERPRAQIDYYHRGGSRRIVYGVGSRGVVVLKDASVARPAFSWGEKNRAITRLFLEHALLVSDFMVSLELACRRSSHVRLLTDAELGDGFDDEVFHWKVSVSDKVSLGIIPDRVFALETTDANNERKRAYFFFEADRGTMPVARQDLSRSSFYRKLIAYEATWTRNIHRSHFGFHRFRVLTVTSSKSRVQNLVQACSQLERGRGLFLFGDNKQLSEHGDPLTFPFLTGHLGTNSTLLD